MRRAILAFISTAAGLVLLLSFKTQPLPTASGLSPTGSGLALGGPSGSGGTNGGGQPGSAGGAGTSTGGSGTSGSGTSGSGTGTRTVTGDPVQTMFGPVQVQITLSGTRITGVVVLQQPNGNFRDQRINSFALPMLTQEALSAQSASIDAVSGATYTSQGYIGSLQSAIDKARK